MDIEKASKTVAVDFDGVLHLFISDWEGVSKIPDCPVPGALHSLIALIKYASKKNYHVAIYSGRSRSWFGRRAMKKWLRHWFTAILEDEVKAKEFVDFLEFPKHKPLCRVMLDDRAYKFSGKFPRPDRLFGFEPWYSKCRSKESDSVEDQNEAGDE